ncbi:DNA/RNA nuclease SfsA [Aliiroseovarius sp. PTFE2010]|uniref:DNA/RNA nuclease SfsA n=1 Tax=Aliiroseovarius sp. PTFE2010 TaxID=3417190 RepID=UPI003CEA368D
MLFQTPLMPARLVRRYKRFLADVILPDGQQVTAHCPNPGSMMGLAEPGLKCWIEPNDDPRKKLKYGWRIVELPGGTMVIVDTMLANRIVAEALEARTIDGLPAFDTVRPEVRYGHSSRVDFLLEGPQRCFLEVKSVTLSRTSGVAEFPDSVTKRGTKHLHDLADVVRNGDQAVLLFLVARNDAALVRPAGDIDPEYAQALHDAHRSGVQIMAYDTCITPQQITLGNRLPVNLF